MRLSTIILNILLWLTISVLLLRAAIPSNPMKFIQIWITQSEIDSNKNCKLGTPVRIDRANGEYIVIPCRIIKEIK